MCDASPAAEAEKRARSFPVAFSCKTARSSLAHKSHFFFSTECSLRDVSNIQPTQVCLCDGSREPDGLPLARIPTRRKKRTDAISLAP
eukprot:783458-Pyramimonas_sp.AAC.1